MSLQQVIKVYWYCAKCNYQTEAEPVSAKCSACGDQATFIKPIYDEVYFEGVKWLDKL